MIVRTSPGRASTAKVTTMPTRSFDWKAAQTSVQIGVDMPRKRDEARREGGLPMPLLAAYGVEAKT